MIVFDIFTPLSPPSLILSSPWGKQHRQPVQMDGLLTMLCVCCLRDDVQLDSVCVRDLTEANRMGRGQHTHYVSVHWQLSACGSETRDVKQRYCITLADAVFFFPGEFLLVTKVHLLPFHTLLHSFDSGSLSYFLESKKRNFLHLHMKESSGLCCLCTCLVWQPLYLCCWCENGC